LVPILAHDWLISRSIVRLLRKQLRESILFSSEQKLIPRNFTFGYESFPHLVSLLELHFVPPWIHIGSLYSKPLRKGLDFVYRQVMMKVYQGIEFLYRRAKRCGEVSFFCSFSQLPELAIIFILYYDSHYSNRNSITHD
jgi:hypothetical protein